MDFQRQSVGILKERHGLAGKRIEPNGFAGDAQRFQLLYGLLHALYPEREMAKARCLGIAEAFRRRLIGHKDFELRVAELQIELDIVRAHISRRISNPSFPT